MSMHDHSDGESETPHGSFLTSRAGLVFIGFAIIAGALLFTEHRAHVLGLLIWLPLLACPVCTENLIRVDAVMESPKLAE